MSKTDRATKNILFIMCDQLRWDYLSCYGHTTLNTPNIDDLARQGVCFDNAYCQAPLCGPSRTSFYSGRYQSSHGVMANQDATRLDEKMVADYLQPLGYRCAVVGKTHNRKDAGALDKLGVDPRSAYARASQAGGFEPFEHHEGLYPDPVLPESLPYNDYLRSKGYGGFNPWHEWANSGETESGELASGWYLRNSIYPTRVAAEHSETAWTTSRAIDFIDQQESGQPWCLHLSYIKPHWPIVAPAPYHSMFGADDVQAAVRADSEKENPHPVVDAFMQLEYSQSYADESNRRQILPAYMGLIRQIDDELGRLFDYLKNQDLMNNTMIIFTSDHGDYLGDHWLGEKDLFHEASVKIPLIVMNPDDSANSTRGSRRNEMVEAIDLLPTFIEFCGGTVCRERLEGHSLLPLLTSTAAVEDWREFAVSETDYSDRGARSILNQPPYDCRATMIRDQRFKYSHYINFRPQLFDLREDPDELNDLGESPDYQEIKQQMRQRLVDWRQRLKPRIGQAFENLSNMGPESDEKAGFLIGRW